MRHEIDDPSLKSIMIPNLEIHYMTITFLGHTGMVRLYNAIKQLCFLQFNGN